MQRRLQAAQKSSKRFFFGCIFLESVDDDRPPNVAQS